VSLKVFILGLLSTNLLCALFALEKFLNLLCLYNENCVVSMFCITCFCFKNYAVTMLFLNQEDLNLEEKHLHIMVCPCNSFRVEEKNNLILV
jgi:hypothetical protein